MIEDRAWRVELDRDRRRGHDRSRDNKRGQRDGQVEDAVAAVSPGGGAFRGGLRQHISEGGGDRGSVEMFDHVGAPALTHLAGKDGIRREGVDGRRERGGVLGRGDDPAAGLLDHVRRLTPQRGHDGLAGRHRLVHLGGPGAPENVERLESNDRGVRQAQECRHDRLRLVGQEHHVADPLPVRLLAQGGLLGPLAGEHVEDVGVRGPLRGLQHDVKALRQAVRSRIQEHLPAREAELPRQLGVRHSRAIHVDVHTVGQQDQLLAANSTCGEPVQDARRRHRDARRPAVEMPFEHLGRIDRDRVAQRAKLDRRLRPDVADVQHERRALDRREGQGGDADRQRRRFDEEHVGRSQRAERGEARCDKRKMVGDAFGEARVGRRVDPPPDDADALDLLFHREPPAIALGDDSCRIVRKTREHGDVVALFDEPLGELEQTRLRRAHLRRKVVGEERDPHRRCI